MSSTHQGMCPECGVIAPADRPYCEMCGAVIDGHGSTAPQNPLNDRQTGWNVTLFVLVLVAGLLLLLLAGWMIG